MSRRTTGSEHTEQAALFAWARLLQGQHPELRWLAAWPNGGHRAKKTAAMLKAEGVQPGPPDVWLPVRRGTHPGLVIEMKIGRNKVTPAQQEWLMHLSGQGWAICVCYGWAGAARVVAEYLGFDSGLDPANTLRGAVVAALEVGE
jgi:hypothetical protein